VWDWQADAGAHLAYSHSETSAETIELNQVAVGQSVSRSVGQSVNPSMLVKQLASGPVSQPGSESVIQPVGQTESGPIICQENFLIESVRCSCSKNISKHKVTDINLFIRYSISETKNSASRLGSQPISQPISQSVNQSVSQSLGQSVGRSVSQ